MNIQSRLETAREALKRAQAEIITQKITDDDVVNELSISTEAILDALDTMLEQRRPTTFTVRVGRAGQIVIPYELRKKYNVVPGTEVTLDLWMEEIAQ